MHVSRAVYFPRSGATHLDNKLAPSEGAGRILGIRPPVDSHDKRGPRRECIAGKREVRCLLGLITTMR